MTRRTLAEAAAEVLAASKSGAPAMAREELSGKEVRDLGGSSQAHPDGGDISTGKAASNAASMASSAQRSKTPVGSQAAETLPAQAQNSVTAEVQPPLATPSGDNETGKKVMQKEGTEADGEVVEDELPTAEEIAEAAAARAEMVREKIKSISVDEDVTAMFAGTDLSEEFKTKAKTIFEAAVVARAIVVVEELEKDILAAAEESVEEIKEELEGSVNTYLDYMVEEWMKDNTVAIESNLRTEIVEDFIGGLKGLFVEHNFNVPTESVDAVEALTVQVTELQSKINETLNTNIELTQKVNTAKKLETLISVCEGLTATQVEKIKTLAEGVEFTTDGEYREKLNIIREQYFTNNKVKQVAAGPVALSESQAPMENEEIKEITGVMSHYVNAISKTTVK